MRRLFACLIVTAALAIALPACFVVVQSFGKDGKPPKAANQGKGKKVGQETELPPGWKNWDEAKRQQWRRSLELAKSAVRKDTESRLAAALRALERVARKGVPISSAAEMAKAGIEHGLGPFDFEPMGKFVVEKVRQGLRGKDLSNEIRKEVVRRQEERKRLREKMKEDKRAKKSTKIQSSPRKKGAGSSAKPKSAEKSNSPHHPKTGKGSGKRGKKK